METHISSELCALIPEFKVGVIHYKNIQIGDSPQMVKGRLQLFQESLYFDLESKSLTDLAGIKEWRAIFKQTGKDPNRYRHSAEALYRRIKKQQYVQPVHSAIDLNTFFSLQYEVPIGVYDADKLHGNLKIAVGMEGDEYQGLNGRMNSLQHLIYSADEEGPFGSPFVDSVRSAVSESTTNAVQIVYLRPSLPVDEADKMVKSFMNMFVQVHGGDGQYKIISC